MCLFSFGVYSVSKTKTELWGEKIQKCVFISHHPDYIMQFYLFFSELKEEESIS